MTYAETRDEETLRLLKPAIDAFIAACKRRRSTRSACQRQTLFFFPAGTASRLVRARKRFEDDDPSPQEFQYDPVWVTPLTLLGGARDLAMHRDKAGTFRDKGDRIIVADKALDFAGCTPHDGLVKWARKNNVLLFVFPWDWRRRLDETVTFFVAKFLPHFRKRVIDETCPDPLEHFSILGHSFGGMIANLILRSRARVVSRVEHVITVATPFYGYAGQLHRWFEGEDYLNLFGQFEQDMIEMIASLPGLYTLHFLDEGTFEANKDALRQGRFPLRDYPSKDKRKSGRADPYNPKTYGRLVRYPGLTGFDLDELEYAECQFEMLASPMNPDLLKKFHNIRGVTTTGRRRTPAHNTVSTVTWDWISSKYDATDESPIKDGRRLVPGDGTQPAWTTSLVTNRDRCVTVCDSGIDHAFMLNHTGVLEAIQGILCPQGGAVNPREGVETEPASDRRVEQLLQWLSKNLLELRDVKSFDELSSRSGVPRSLQRNLPNLARRFISDVMKRPGPEGLRKRTLRGRPGIGG